MATLAADKLSVAVQHHQVGSLERADRLYRQVLARDPRNADALHLRGLLAADTGQLELAVELIRRAITIRPGSALFNLNLARILMTNGRIAEAVECYQVAISGAPSAELLNELGSALQEIGRPDEALEYLQKAIQLNPKLAVAHNALAVTLIAMNRVEEALAASREAARLDNKAVHFHLNVAMTLRLLRREEEAIVHVERALALEPANADALNSMGCALCALDKASEATVYYRRAIAIDKKVADYHHNLGVALQMLQRPEEAIAAYREALARQDYHDTRIGLAMCQLMLGRLQEAWPGFDFRLQALFERGVRPTLPIWTGDAAEGRTLLVVAEHGFGDSLQFCRYLPFVRQRGFRVIVMAPNALLRLFRESFSDVQIQPYAEAVGDVYIPMMSLPRMFDTSLDTIPAQVYLHADPARVRAWRERLAPLQGLRAGLVWAGNAREKMNRRRSIAPERLAPLFDVSGVSWFSLQKTAPFAPPEFPLIDYMSEMTDFSDTAALVANLDLVISVDSAMAHLAAGMGKPVWLLNRFDTCWRWLLERKDSPWYPTLRIYRQPAPGDWDSVLAAVQHDLGTLAAPRAA